MRFKFMFLIPILIASTFLLGCLNNDQYTSNTTTPTDNPPYIQSNETPTLQPVITPEIPNPTTNTTTENMTNQTYVPSSIDIGLIAKDYLKFGPTLNSATDLTLNQTINPGQCEPNLPEMFIEYQTMFNTNTTSSANDTNNMNDTNFSTSKRNSFEDIYDVLQDNTSQDTQTTDVNTNTSVESNNTGEILGGNIDDVPLMVTTIVNSISCQVIPANTAYYVFTYNSTDNGYGDTAVPTTTTTTHVGIVKVENFKITLAVIDGVWDEINQRSISNLEDYIANNMTIASNTNTSIVVQSNETMNDTQSEQITNESQNTSGEVNITDDMIQ